METVLGFALIIITILVGTSIGVRANKNVRAFNEEEHEIFVGSEEN